MPQYVCRLPTGEVLLACVSGHQALESVLQVGWLLGPGGGACPPRPGSPDDAPSPSRRTRSARLRSRGDLCAAWLPPQERGATGPCKVAEWRGEWVLELTPKIPGMLQSSSARFKVGAAAAAAAVCSSRCSDASSSIGRCTVPPCPPAPRVPPARCLPA